MKPVRVGRVVHYVPEPAHGAGPREHWAAVVTDPSPHGDTCVWLTITSPPKGPCNVSVPYDATGRAPHSWHHYETCREAPASDS